MSELTISLPAALQSWIEARVAEGRHVDAEDYLRDLVRRDRDCEQTETAWLRAMIDEGLSSGIIDREPEAILDEVLAEDPDLRA